MLFFTSTWHVFHTAFILCAGPRIHSELWMILPTEWYGSSFVLFFKMHSVSPYLTNSTRRKVTWENIFIRYSCWLLYFKIVTIILFLVRVRNTANTSTKHGVQLEQNVDTHLKPNIVNVDCCNSNILYSAISYNIYTCVYSLWPEKMTVWCTVYMYSIWLQPLNSCQMHECTVFIFSKSAGQFSDHSESMCMTSSHWGSKAWYYCKCMIVFPYTHLQLAPLWMETRQYLTIVCLNCMHGF